MAREKTMSISVDNTPEGWTHLLEQGNGVQSIVVTTQIYGALDDQQLFSLRHCFIALDQLEVQYKAPVSLALHISVNSINDAYRVQHYLAIMTTFRNVALEIICDEERLLGLQRLSNEYYRIMPLLCIGNKQQSWEIHYLEITKPGNTDKIRELVQASFQPKSPVTHL